MCICVKRPVACPILCALVVVPLLLSVSMGLPLCWCCCDGQCMSVLFEFLLWRWVYVSVLFVLPLHSTLLWKKSFRECCPPLLLLPETSNNTSVIHTFHSTHLHSTNTTNASQVLQTQQKKKSTAGFPLEVVMGTTFYLNDTKKESRWDFRGVSNDWSRSKSRNPNRLGSQRRGGLHQRCHKTILNTHSHSHTQYDGVEGRLWETGWSMKHCQERRAFASGGMLFLGVARDEIVWSCVNQV